MDGNKRVGFAATYTFLAVNGLTLVVDQSVAFEFIIGLFETRQFDFTALNSWLRDHAR